MYRYDEFDHRFVTGRVDEFRDQVRRRLSGELTEEEFRPLRLMNGVYLQLHAYMLRVAIPYGTLSSAKLRGLAHVARRYDKGYGHFTTRQNIQFNWIRLEDVPDILADLAEVELHAIQTSGNCIRNVSADHFSAAARDEIADPRVYAEILRQWSSLHPEFTYLPRKFKIAVNGATHDRAAIQVHDIGLQIVSNEAGERGFTVYVGGGLGRTPMIGKKVRDFLPEGELLSYCEAILRVYNQFGRRDNKYKARAKIMLHEAGLDVVRRQIEEEYEDIKRRGDLTLPGDEIEAISAYFAVPNFETLPERSEVLERARLIDAQLADFVAHNVEPHKAAGYGIVTISLKATGAVPGDATAEQMDAIADIAERYSFDELRVSHEQNLVLPHVKLDDLPAVFAALQKAGVGTGNAGLITDIMCCPGLDYCSLANARSIPLAQRISERFEDIARQHEIGDLKIKISGCINACGHHHVAHIGILGVDRKGEEFYQITLGGSGDDSCSIGGIVGRGFSTDDVVDAIETIVNTYVAQRESADEPFLAFFRRVGEAPFKEALYGADPVAA
ncbi:nitrite/sulfite reductase [Pseudochelatococcus sp. G4_1912]|uniref:nitrite/sulfite reductase n=1 Tax=Pseudochelatococcus sp. G4_1912 TaxID=3114288 RepID=UPI0039C7352B